MSEVKWSEQAVIFNCEGCRLVGIATIPFEASETGVVIVVGGPQYRSGSHRQFTLLARQLAEQNIPAFRFDYRGMGDSEGEMRNFEHIEKDLLAAIDTFVGSVPTVKRVILWGLCDAASAALYYGQTDSRVSGLILLNPWVHSESGAARTRLKHYYLTRLFQKSFWSKLLQGKVAVGASLGGLAKSARLASGTADKDSPPDAPVDPRHGSAGYIERMLNGLKRYQGNVLFILSEKDLTAQEFVSLTKRDRSWSKACNKPQVSTLTLPGANHTFSTQKWRNQVGDWSGSWIKSH